MSGLLTIELNQLRFTGFHGLYPEERILGNTFICDLAIRFPAPEQPVTQVEQTVNYAAVYDLIKKRMQTPVNLLETLAMTIADDIAAAFPFVKEISIRITKTQVPVPGMQGQASVLFTRTV